MTIKKVYRNIELTINLLGNTSMMTEENVIEDICLSFNEVVCLDKHEEFNSLMQKQQKNNRHILMSTPKPFDKIRLLLKMLNNYLISTNQFTLFSIESITIFEEDEITAHGSEIYLGDISEITFSPSTRSHWTKPQLMQIILLLG